MTTVTVMMTMEPVLHALSDTLSTVESALQLTLSVRPSMLMEPALLVILKTSSTMDHVFQSINSLTSFFTTLPAAPRSLQLSKPAKKAIDFIEFMIIYHYLYHLKNTILSKHG